MHERGLPVQAALEWIARYHADCLARFRALADTLPHGDDVKRYVQGLAEGIRGIDAWCFESQRYFGIQGPVVQQTRIVVLLPPRIQVGEDVVTPMTVSEADVAPTRSEQAHSATAFATATS
jgi:hypothetical protein